jgi:hypothetical protein
VPREQPGDDENDAEEFGVGKGVEKHGGAGRVSGVAARRVVAVLAR